MRAHGCAGTRVGGLRRLDQALECEPVRVEAERSEQRDLDLVVGDPGGNATDALREEVEQRLDEVWFVYVNTHGRSGEHPDGMLPKRILRPGRLSSHRLLAGHVHPIG